MNFKELVSELSSIPNNKIVFVGLGNPARGDDGAGIIFVNELERTDLFKRASYIQAFTTPENYLGKISALHPEIVIFIDAVKMEGAPGSIASIESDQIDSKGFSTHSYSIKLIEKYLTAEGVSAFKYIGIIPKNMDVSQNISAEVLQGIHNFFN